MPSKKAKVKSLQDLVPSALMPSKKDKVKSLQDLLTKKATEKVVGLGRCYV